MNDQSNFHEMAECLQQILATMKELLRWVKFSSRQEVRQFLETTLEPGLDRAIYQASIHKRTGRDVAKVLRLQSHMAVHRRWNNWAPMGLVEPYPEQKGRYRRIFDLEELGIPLEPEAPAKEAQDA